jgi:hypothetical protein
VWGCPYISELGNSLGLDVNVVGLEFLSDLVKHDVNVFLLILLVRSQPANNVSQILLKHPCPLRFDNLTNSQEGDAIIGNSNCFGKKLEKTCSLFKKLVPFLK